MPDPWFPDVVGHKLGDWNVLSAQERSSVATGGQFSRCFIVQNAHGNHAFLKALDIGHALQAPNVTLALEAMTAAFNHEAALLEDCRTNRMDRVVRAIDSG